MKILILSPHRGTAAFSLTSAITRWRAERHSVTVLNVFSRSLDAPYSDADTVHENDRLSYVSALRRKEDESFRRQIPGLTMIDLNLKDAPIRLRCDRASVGEIALNPEDPAIAKIHKALATTTYDALVVPLAVGGHIDHRVVREAALAASASTPSVFYEDQPYTAQAAKVEENLVSGLTPIILSGAGPEPVHFKRRMAVHYASQIDGRQADVISQYRDGTERLWANPAWIAAPGLVDREVPE